MTGSDFELIPRSSDEFLLRLFGDRLMIPAVHFAQAHGVSVAQFYRQRKSDPSLWPETQRIGRRDMVHLLHARAWYEARNLDGT